MATAARQSNGLLGFLTSALAALMQPRLVLPALALTVLLTASNIVIVMNVPAEGGRPGPAFAAAATVRIAGLLVLMVAILRIINQSRRRPFMLDAGFWLYVLTFALTLAATVVVRSAIGEGATLPGLLLSNAVVAVLLAPLTPWFVALAVARPVPWSPATWVRVLPFWLPHFLFWTLLVVTPLAALHGLIDYTLVEGAGEAFWPLALIDGPLSVAMALIGAALGSEAYRRVAQS